jgi:hypothetical protein
MYGFGVAGIGWLLLLATSPLAAQTMDAAPATSPAAAPPFPSPPALFIKQYNFLQEGGLVTPGSLQIEQDLSLAHRLKSDHSFSGVGGVTQLDYAVDERCLLTLIAATCSYTTIADTEATTYDGSGFQFYYALTDPDKCPVGVAVFQGLVLGPTDLGLDTRLILNHTPGDWNITYNLGTTSEFSGLDGGGVATASTIDNDLAVAYTFHPNSGVVDLSVGIESTLSSSFAEWRHYVATSAYAGPVTAMTFASHFSLTLTSLYELTDTADAPHWRLAAALVYTF